MSSHGGGGSHGGRQACGSLCPNRVQELSERLGRKPAKVEKKDTRKIRSRCNAIAIYNDPLPESVDVEFPTIDWEELAECTSVFQQVSKVNTAQQVTDLVPKWT